MSIINNIQGTLTQTQQAQQLNQQQSDQARVQQHVGEVKNEQDWYEKRTSVSEKDDAGMNQLGKDGSSGDQRDKERKRKKQKDHSELSEEDLKMGLGLLGGGLLDCQA